MAIKYASFFTFEENAHFMSAQLDTSTSFMTSLGTAMLCMPNTAHTHVMYRNAVFSNAVQSMFYV